MRNGLRPICRSILDHCVQLTLGLDEETTSVLVGLQRFDPKNIEEYELRA